MMTIDEAIDREKEIHEANQKVVDTHVLHEEFTLEELYCDDTEVIEEHLNNYRFASEYHKQLSEWLEELKFIKQWKADIMEGFCKYDASSFEEIVYNAKNKAIDEFITRAYRKLGCSEKELYCADFIDEIAEQMKNGG